MCRNQSILFTLILFILLSCKIQEKTKTTPLEIELTETEKKIKERWEYDYCGYLGVRDSLLYFFDTSNYLIGKDSVLIQNILGKPHSRSEDDGLNYYYTVEGYIDDDNNCNIGEGFSQFSLGIYFNKDFRVKSIQGMLH